MLERRRHLLSGRRRNRDEQGVSALELAFIAPALIFLIFFSIQGALYFYGRSVAIQASREGVSQLRLSKSETEYDARRGDVVRNTENFAHQIGRESLLDPHATPTYADDTGRVSMTVQGRVITLIPWLELTTTVTSYGSVERFEAE